MRRVSSLLMLTLCAGVAFGAQPSALEHQQAEARKEREALQARIAQVRERIEGQESARRDAANALKASESAISSINLRLAQLADRRKEVEAELDHLAVEIQSQKAVLAQRQQELGEQLRGQYAGRLSPWTALLSGDDPQSIGRDFSYLGYVTKSQAAAIQTVRDAVAELDGLQVRTREGKQELVKLADEAADRRKALQAQKREREQVLARIEDALAQQRSQASTLTQNEQRLGDLITGLQAEIARQAEQARREEARRQAEAARQAREQAERQRAERERASREAEQARLQVERARERAREEEQKAQQAPERFKGSVPGLYPDGSVAGGLRPDEMAPAPPDAQIAGEGPPKVQPVREAPAPQASPARPAPPRGFHGLDKNLPFPVQGTVQGRFGASRPEGGVWRGIVLRAPAGTAVHAIAQGRVVFSNWLSGFGNLMIIDHGAGYLSVYAYNQSLLKQVGDIVGSGDTIATVGATGGQVEPGLYFEIRHQGTPVNPLLWLGG